MWNIILLKQNAKFFQQNTLLIQNKIMHCNNVEHYFIGTSYKNRSLQCIWLGKKMIHNIITI